MDKRNQSVFICFLFAAMLAGGLLLSVLLPKAAESASERRALAGMPRLSVQSLQSGRFMSGFEAYATDHFPFRDSFRTLKAMCAAHIFAKKDNNGIYETDGFLAAVEYPRNDASLERAAERFRAVCERYLTAENRVYLSVIPDKGCFLARESGHLCMDYADFEKEMETFADFAQYIRISDLLERDDYYRTDTHWRQERISDVAERLAQAMDTTLVPDYEMHTLTQDFYGVYYGQAALPLAPDKLSCLTGAAIDGCTAYDWQNDRKIPVYDLKRAWGRDPYELFLSGPLSLITIENPQAQTGRRLVIFRDSFASSLAPLLVSGYAQITLVDIRYIHPDALGELVDFSGCDVLFLYSTLVLNNSGTLK